MELGVLSEIFTDPVKVILALVDILIVAYLFYRILLLIRGTRAEQLLRGLLLLLGFSVASRYLHLEIVQWLADKLWTMLFIALPVVFQPELRRALEQLGRGSFFSSSLARWTDTEVIIHEILDAVNTLARTRTGALIIIERETGIRDYVDSGVPVDGVVNSQLLVNIFTPLSPLHDGAVIISDGRLARAACFLPLTDNPNLSKELGTRHRAGLGITEVSDALALIVSEETGWISVAREGRLSRNLDEQRLQEILETELVKKDRREAFKVLRWANEREPKEHD
ncbi:MAG: TIGR00159 family protein [Syntrophomonadaceae bacterium]|mgnify:CR=1 FL=1|nr:TIGR00159 family protein [Syntrophomonadaceae bacterium]